MSSLLGFVLPSANDKSVFILNQIMGHITAMIDPSAAPESGAGSATVFSNMMMNFNHVLLGAGTILFAIMVFVGTMNTSNEGTLFGRQWNAMWTPLRLIFGLIFVVPLQSGFCIGQKIILYAILIGISMGTHVWDAVVQQVFDDPAPPPIPSFMYNMVQQRVALEFVTDASLKIYACAQGNCKSDQSLSNTIINTSPMLVHTAPVGGKQIPGDRYASTAMVGALQQQGEGVCDNLFIGLNTVCQAAVGNAIQSGQGNYTYTDPITQSKFLIGIGSGNSNSTPNAFNSSGSLNVYFSSGSESPGDGIGVSSQQYGLGGTNGGHPKLNNTSSGVSDMDADGQISIEKSLIKYNLNTKAITNSPQGKKIAEDIVKPYVIDGKSCDPNKDDMCNFQTYTDNYMNQLKAQLPNQLAPKQTEGQHQNLVCTAFDSQGNCTAWKYNLTHYWLPSQIGGAPNANNQINLLNSWWIAGESYIILDDQLSRALKMLYQDIQKDMGQMGDGAGSENSVQSAYLIKNQISIWELGPHASTSDYGYPATCMPIYLPNSSSNPFEFINNAGTATFPQGPFLPQAMNLADPKYKFLNSSAGNFQNAITYQGNPALYTVSPTPGNSADNQNWPFASCLGDEARGSQVLTYQYWLVDSGIINPGTYPNPDNLDKGGPFTWSDLIEKFNPHAPNAICTNQACGPTYGLLQKLPPEYQFPAGIMLSQLYTSYSKHHSEHPVSGGSTYFDDAAPYMENMLTVLDDNKILSNQTVQLPVKSSLDRIFEGLLGSQGGTFSDDSQGVTVSANSVLQELYNLGSDPKTNGVVSKQFSLIQQAQTVGMSMIMVALNSITTVYNHFANKLTSFNQYLENVGIGVTATAAALGALGFVPFIGSAATGAAQLTVSITQLIVQLKTIAVMTAVGMSLAWLPIAAFVLISIFTTGIQFALLIPLMPYILFWAGQIAWLLGAIEGVVAAPIIMLGLATPGGHDFMGHTVPAVKMLLGVVFRPVLMVIGMVTGILLTYVVIHFSAQGFHTVLNLLLNNFSNADQSAMGVLMLIATLTYGTLMVMAFTKCFSPIYQIPEKVMQWIGGQADRAGQEELQQVSGAVQQSSQKAGESGQSGVSSGIEAQKQQTQQTQGAWSSGMQGIQQGVSGLTSGIKQDTANFSGQSDNTAGGASGGGDAEAAAALV